MDWRDMPPLSALRAFAAFAETGNVTAAGDALNVSHAAISQQLRSLEAHVGQTLLDRSGRALRLTAAGQELSQAVTLGFGAIARVVSDLSQVNALRPVQVSVTPTFASAWLMPRLANFRRLHPQIDLMINPTPELVTLEPGGIDVALRYGDGNWPGLDVQPLLISPMVVVASPDLVAGRPVNSPEDLRDLPWLEEFGTTEANNWLKSHGVVGDRNAGTFQLPGNLLLDGVRDGQGVAVTVRHFVQSDLAAERLCVLFEEATNSGYHIVTRPGVLRPPLRSFVTWLARQKDALEQR